MADTIKFSLEYPSQEEAKTGTDNEKLMTPLRTAQHVDNRINYYTTTISTSDWSGTEPATAVKTVSGILSSDRPVVDVDLSSVDFEDIADVAGSWGLVYRATTASGSITLYSFEKPEVELPIQIKVVR